MTDKNNNKKYEELLKFYKYVAEKISEIDEKRHKANF